MNVPRIHIAPEKTVSTEFKADIPREKMVTGIQTPKNGGLSTCLVTPFGAFKSYRVFRK